MALGYDILGNLNCWRKIRHRDRTNSWVLTTSYIVDEIHTMLDRDPERRSALSESRSDGSLPISHLGSTKFLDIENSKQEGKAKRYHNTFDLTTGFSRHQIGRIHQKLAAFDEKVPTHRRTGLEDSGFT